MGVKNISVIENGIYIKKLSPTIHKEAIPTFIFVSRLVKMKGIEDVLEAFSYIVKEIPQAVLWIVGSGSAAYQHLLNKKVEELGVENSVKFFGKVPEIKKYELMKKAHIFLHASVKEGWGLVIIEAASQGTPAVTYNVKGLRDSVQDKKTGELTNKNT